MAINIFLAYARKDELSVRKLENSLTRILQENSFSIHTCEIGQINREDDLSLSTADLILLLVSPDFLDSDYCYRTEMAQALERSKQNEAHIIPLILRPVYWGRTPFSRLQALPENAKPIALSDDQEATFGEVALTISTIVRNKGVWKESDESRKDKKELPTTTYRYPTLRILALGEPMVFLNEVLITRWRMARAMELFFFLLESGRPMHKEQIITTLWPVVEMNERIDQTFRATIYYLRKALANADEELRSSVIISQGGTYSLNLSVFSGEVQYDVARFEEQYRQAKQFLTHEDDAAAKEAFLTMIQLYRGDYIQSFYTDWCIFRREKLRLIYLDARQQLALIAWRAEEFDESIVHWQHMLVVDNSLEEAHYGLMRCYWRQGKRGLALRQYQRCVDILEQDRTAPKAPIQNLYQQLLLLSE